MRKFLVMLALAAFSSLPTLAAVSVSIGINVPHYPNLQRIPGYPVYYVPRLNANYFFYDGLYWVYVPGGWYASPWYDGPWELVDIDSVPLYVLRVPVRYYGSPPVEFRHWRTNAPPRWDVVWGPDWGRRHHHWDRWNRAAAPAPAPLPRYQQRYTRDNYPNDSQRSMLIQRHYGYAPRDAQARQQWRAHVGEASTHPQQSQARADRPHDTQAREVYPARGYEMQANEPPIQRRAPVARPEPRPEPRRAHAPEPPAAPVATRDMSGDGSPPRNARPDQGGRSDKHSKGDRGDKGDKGDKRDDHDAGKHR